MRGPVNIEKVDGPQGPRIHLQTAYYPGAPEDAKMVPGYNWSKTQKVWTYPLSLQTCRDLRSVYGQRLVIGPALTAWARAEVGREKQLHTLGRQLDANLHRVHDISPRLSEAMVNRTYQRSGAAFIRTARSVLIADEPSMGKTATALAGIMEAGMWPGKHLVIAPLTSLESTWARQIRLWSDGEPFPMPQGAPQRKRQMEAFLESRARSKFLIINPAMVRVKMMDWCPKCQEWLHIIQPDKLRMPDVQWEAHFGEGHKVRPEIFKCDWPELFEQKWNSIIHDESHETLAAYSPSNKTQSVEGLLRLQSAPGGLRIALTGTPLRGREQRIWGTLDWLGATSGGYWSWISTYFKTEDNGYGMEIKGLKEERHDDFSRLLDTVVLRRLKSEVRQDLPDNQTIDHWVSLTPAQRKVYEEFESLGEAEMAGGLLTSSGMLSELTRLRQLAFGSWKVERVVLNDDPDDTVVHLKPTGDSPKVDMLLALLRERGVTGNPKEDWTPETGGHKFVVASQFTQVVDVVEQRLNAAGIETLKVTGAVTGQRRIAAVKQFDESPDGPRVMLINTKAGGVSIDLDTYCDEMFILDETFVDDDQVQLKGRIDNRKGEPRVRTFHYVRTLDTLEEGIANGNLHQAEITALLLDVRRGAKVNIRTMKLV